MNSNDDINQQCEEVIQAMQQVRNVFRSTSRLTTADLVNRFWDFQDSLHRLVNTLADPQAALTYLDHSYPKLMSNATEVLALTSQTQVGSIPAVSHSCRAIQGFLFELKNLRPVTMLAPLA